MGATGFPSRSSRAFAGSVWPGETRSLGRPDSTLRDTLANSQLVRGVCFSGSSKSVGTGCPLVILLLLHFQAERFQALASGSDRSRKAPHLANDDTGACVAVGC